MLAISSKTHRFISIRTTPSKYMLKLYHEGSVKGYIALIDTYEKYLKFYNDFIKIATGKDYNYYRTKYFFGAKECSEEELHELTGILIATSGNNEIYCIPINCKNENLFDYIIENVPVKFKVISKTRGTYMDHGASRWVRDSNQLSDEMKIKLK